MIAVIGYGNLHARTRASEANPKIRSDRYYGILIYQPICWTKKQFARWVELTAYRRNPFCERNGLGEGTLSDLTAYLNERHGIRIREFSWPTTLMLLAIPFAKDRVTLVIPTDFQVDPLVFERAKRYGITVSTVPLTLFPERERQRVSLNHMAPVITFEPECIYDRSVEEAIAESQKDNQDLVPQSWLDFGNDLT